MEDQSLTLSQEYKLASEVYRHVDPFNFYDKFLKEGVRPDGRELYSYRKVVVKDLLNSSSFLSNFTQSNSTLHLSSEKFSLNQHQLKGRFSPGPSNVKRFLVSSVLLVSGSSQYQCKVTADLKFSDVSDLNLENPNDFVSVEVLVPKHVATEIYDVNGPCINVTHMVSDLLEKVLNSAEVLPKEQFSFDLLCQKAGEVANGDFVLNFLTANRLYWRLKFEVVCDEYDGNLLDMCFTCCTQALLYSKFPLVLLVPHVNQFTPLVLHTTTLQSLQQNKNSFDLLSLNANFLLLQLSETMPLGQAKSLQDLIQFLTLHDVHKKLQLNSLPHTLTFCKCLNYFLLDPTREEEQIGVNFTVYALRDSKGKSDFLLQPLNPMGLTDVSDDTLDRLYEISRVILKSML